MAADRILITGANGFVGGWLRAELVEREVPVEIFAVGHGAGAEGRTVDITDHVDVLRLVRECRPTAVVHLAAIAAPADARDAPRRAWAVNVNGTMNLAYAVMEAAPQARFVFVGSSEVYGASFNDTPTVPLDEDAALKPLNVYGATKAAADLMIGQMAHDGLKAIRFRPFNHTGPGQTEAFVVPAFAKQLVEVAAGRKPPVIDVGNLHVYRDFLDVRDVVRAYADAALVDLPAAVGMTFNLASGRPVQIKALLDELIGLTGLDVEIRVDPDRLRGTLIETVAGNASAASEMFGWRPKIPLATTLRDVLDGWKRKCGVSDIATSP